MARILLRREAFESGRFPPVCCKTGQQADTYSVWEFTHTPGWAYILIPFGILPFLIVLAFATKHFKGILPMNARAQQRLIAARRMVWGFGLAGIGLALLGLTLAEPLIAGIAAAVGVAWLVTMVCVWIWSPNARLDDDNVIDLGRVHPSFVEAIRSGYEPAPPPTDEQQA